MTKLAVKWEGWERDKRHWGQVSYLLHVQVQTQTSIPAVPRFTVCAALLEAGVGEEAGEETGVMEEESVEGRGGPSLVWRT